MVTTARSAPTRSLPKKKRVWRKRLWRTATKKREFIVAHISKELTDGPKTFDELHEGVKRAGITDHYLSDILGDMLLYERTIVSKWNGEQRIYRWADSQN